MNINDVHMNDIVELNECGIWYLARVQEIVLDRHGRPSYVGVRVMDTGDELTCPAGMLRPVFAS